MAHCALIIDDEADIRELIALSLERIGIDTHTAANLEEASNLLHTYRFDVCLSDMRLPDGNGVEFLQKAHAIQPQLPIAVITAHGNMHAAVEALKNGAFDFVSKPVDLNLLRKLVMQAIDSNAVAANEPVPQSESIERKNDSPTLQSLARQSSSSDSAEIHDLKGGENLIGCSDALQELRSMITKVAKTNAPVWITGESGTGKELIARLIHDNGSRAEAPFVAINCGAIPSELMESEMFGHLKGSFTGAHADTDGLFQRAHNGTLFLDEVAELPLHMQVKLLRAIQERSIKPVGSSSEISVDVRILSASHVNLADAVRDGTFRNDLYYRLNVISIESPPLRKRREDIPLLIDFILSSNRSNRDDKDRVALSQDAVDELMDYDFPGNIRELENLMERASALCDNNVVTAEDLSLGSNHKNREKSDSSDQLSDDANKRQLLAALEQTRWNRRAAAQLLGISYRQLRYRIKKHNLDKPDND
ncbi:MAG: sigma-54 dependent transcriptional regulator [Granulosicoccus sp.]|nr:sigma-54 dependent transcriptional regulator [Granulosicoccus sp.]